jgi:hypothetical protein
MSNSLIVQLYSTIRTKLAEGYFESILRFSNDCFQSLRRGVTESTPNLKFETFTVMLTINNQFVYTTIVIGT